jgi:hypothetical protein
VCMCVCGGFVCVGFSVCVSVFVCLCVSVEGVPPCVPGYSDFLILRREVPIWILFAHQIGN